jgi:hypothetical protein
MYLVNRYKSPALTPFNARFYFPEDGIRNQFSFNVRPTGETGYEAANIYMLYYADAFTGVPGCRFADNGER